MRVRVHTTLAIFILGLFCFAHSAAAVDMPSVPAVKIQQDSEIVQTHAYIGDDRKYDLYTDMVLTITQTASDSSFWKYYKIKRVNRKSTETLYSPIMPLTQTVTKYRDDQLLPGMDYTYTLTFSPDTKFNLTSAVTPSFVRAHGRADEPYGTYNPPTNVTATVGQHRTKIALKWESTGGKYFAIYRTTSLDEKMVPVYAWTTSRSFTDKDVVEGVRYYYAVKTTGENRAENASQFSQWTYGQAGLTMPKDASEPIKVWNGAVISLRADTIVSADFQPDLAPKAFPSAPAFHAKYYDIHDKLKAISLPTYKFMRGAAEQKFEFKTDIALLNKKLIGHYYRINKSVNILLKDYKVPDSVILYSYYKMNIDDAKEQGQSRILLAYCAPKITSFTPAYSLTDTTPVLYNRNKKKPVPEVSGYYFGKKVKVYLEYRYNTSVRKYALPLKNAKTQPDKAGKVNRQLTNPVTGFSCFTIKLPSKFTSHMPDSSPSSVTAHDPGYTLVIQNDGSVVTQKIYLERNWTPSR